MHYKRQLRSLESVGILWLNACFVAGEEELLQPLVRKALDHELIVT